MIRKSGSRIWHAGGMRPSFKAGQRKYSRSVCGVRIYDNTARRLSRKFKRRPTCRLCQRILSSRRAWELKRKREDRALQLKNYSARRNQENVMRARFGLKPVPYQPPPPSGYWP